MLVANPITYAHVRGCEGTAVAAPSAEGHAEEQLDKSLGLEEDRGP
jgi:hypothetical protein